MIHRRLELTTLVIINILALMMHAMLKKKTLLVANILGTLFSASDAAARKLLAFARSITIRSTTALGSMSKI